MGGLGREKDAKKGGKGYKTNKANKTNKTNKTNKANRKAWRPLDVTVRRLTVSRKLRRLTRIAQALE